MIYLAITSKSFVLSKKKAYTSIEAAWRSRTVSSVSARHNTGGTVHRGSQHRDGRTSKSFRWSWNERNRHEVDWMMTTWWTEATKSKRQIATFLAEIASWIRKFAFFFSCKSYQDKQLPHHTQQVYHFPQLEVFLMDMYLEYLNYTNCEE